MKYIKFLIVLFYFSSCLSIKAQSLRKYTFSKLKTSDFVERLPFSFENNVIIIKNVEVEGVSQKFNFILDSGSEFTFISEKVAKLIGFKSTSEVEITDGYEKLEMKLGFTNFKLGEVEFNNVGVIVNDNVTMAKICGIDGYIGYNLMRSCIWQLKPENIIITDNIKSVKNIDSYNEQKLFNGPVVVAGFTGGFNSTMLFDLGDNGTVEIQESRIDLIKKKEIVTGTGVAYTTGFGSGNKNENSIHTLLKVPAFEFGGSLVKNMVVYTDTAPYLPIDVIGAGILNYYDIVLDFPKKRIHSLCTLDEYKNKGFKTHGFKYNIVNNEMLVSFVWDNSSAYTAGLRVGVKISKLNDLYIKDLSSLVSCEKYRIIDTILNLKTISIVLCEANDDITLTKLPLFNSD